MSAADRLRQSLEQKREGINTETKRKAAAAESARAETARLAETVGAVVGPVFSAAVAIFEDKGFAAKVRDNLRPTSTLSQQTIALDVGLADERVAATLTVYLLAGSAVAVNTSSGGQSWPPQKEFPIAELTDELVWSMVESLGERLPGR